jgi:hypothetical protein
MRFDELYILMNVYRVLLIYAPTRGDAFGSLVLVKSLCETYFVQNCQLKT